MALVLGAGLAIGGCGPSDTSDQVIQEAQVALETLNLSGMSTPPIETARTTYTNVIRDLNKIGDNASDAHNAAAKYLIARANAGLGQLAAAQAAELDRRSLNKIANLQSKLDVWTSQNSLATSLETYDPAAALAELDTQSKAKDAAIAEQFAKKQAVDNEIKGLDDRAAAAVTKAKAERERETTLRAEAVKANETRRLALIEQASERRRASDALEVEAATLKAQAADRTPEAMDLQKEIDRLNTQKQLLATARNDVNAYVKASRDQAKAARTEAQSTGEDIKKLVGELAAARAEITKPSDESKSKFQAAANDAKAAGQKGGNDLKADASLAAGAFQQSLGDLMLTRARGHQANADLLNTLASTKPALPDADAIKAQAAEAQKAYDEALKTAFDAYTAARDSFSKAAGKPEVKERLDRVSAILEQIVKGEIPKANVVGLASTGAAAGATAGSTGGAVAPAGDDVAQARASLERMMKASSEMRIDEAMALVHARNPAEAKMLASLSQLGKGMSKLDAACKAKYKKPLMDILKTNPMMAQMAGGMNQFGGLGSATGADFDITITSPTTATARVKGATDASTDMELIKADGVWKIQLPAAETAGMDQVAPLLDAIGPIFESLAADVSSGKFADENAMMAGLQMKLMPVIMKTMTPPSQPPNK